MNIKKIAVVLIIILLVVYAIYLIPIKVNYEINTIGTILGENNDNNELNVNLTFKGYRSRKIFSSDNFKGSIFIDNMEIKLIEFKIGSEEVVFGHIEGESDVSSIGVIYTDSKFDNVSLNYFNEGKWSPVGGIIFAGPASNRQEALDITNELYVITNSLYKDSTLK